MKPTSKKRPLSHYSCHANAVDNDNKTTTTTPATTTPPSVPPPSSSPPTPLKEQSANIIIQGIVSLATETLRLLGIGAEEYNDQLAAEEEALLLSPPSPLSPGDIDSVLHLLTLDYERAYFVTGVLEDRIYTEDCYFADPTVQFTGRELWKKNLKLLTPFLIDPSIQLKSIGKNTKKNIEIEVEGPVGVEEEDSFDDNNNNTNVELLASWRLMTGLKLPWRPYIDIEGTTRYVLNEERNAICQHIEAWNITGLEALLIVFTPGRKKE